MADDPKSPLDQALDMFVFAPLGLALTVKDELPGLVAKGRQRATGQLAMARMIGQFAVAQGQKEAEKAAGKLVEQATAVAERLGALPDAQGQSAAARRAAAHAEEAARANAEVRTRPITVTGSPAPPASANGAGDAATATNGSATSAAAPKATANAAASKATANAAAPKSTANAAASKATASAAARRRSATDAGSLAIHGYDSLSASQVVQRLAGLSAGELSAVGRYEEAHRGRRTILSKVAQLQAGLG